MRDADSGRDAEGNGVASGEVPAGKRLRGYVLPAVLAVLVIAATAVALLLHSSSKGWDAAARNLVLGAASAMDRCARESGGSYAGCDADKLVRIEPGIGWRDGVAPVRLGRRSGWQGVRGRARRGSVQVADDEQEWTGLLLLLLGRRRASYDAHRKLRARLGRIPPLFLVAVVPNNYAGGVASGCKGSPRTPQSIRRVLANVASGAAPTWKFLPERGERVHGYAAGTNG